MSQNAGAILPHGGKLVNRITQKNTSGMYSFSVSDDLANDVENIADGIFSPLEGFLLREDFESVISRGRLANNLPWTVPIVLDVDKETATKMKDARDVLLKSRHGEFAILHVEETYTFDKEKVAKAVYGTNDTNHPGVAKTFSMNEFLVGGNEDVSHIVVGSELEIGADAVDQVLGVGGDEPLGDVCVPGVIFGEDLHLGDDGISLGGVEGDGPGENGRIL